MPEYSFISPNENPEVKPYPPKTKSRLRYARDTANTGLDLDLKPNYVCRDLKPCPPGCDIGYMYSLRTFKNFAKNPNVECRDLV